MFVVIAIIVGVMKWRVVWERDGGVPHWCSAGQAVAGSRLHTGGISTQPQYLETESLCVNSSQAVFEEIIVPARNGLARWKY